MENVMLDLETMGTAATSAIVAIGAVRFDQDLGVTDKFYTVVDLESSIKKGFDIDGSTVKWWMMQSEAARKEIFGKGVPIKEALVSFQEWLGAGHTQIWGNGSDFDNVILENAFRKYGVVKPWAYHLNRCHRTMVSSFPSIEVDKVGTAHNAVDDAEYQANYLMALVEQNNLLDVL
jgi:exodeoxyribonuclease VIII